VEESRAAISGLTGVICGLFSWEKIFMRRRFVLALTVAAVGLGIGCAKGLNDAGLAQNIKVQISADQQLKNSSLNVSVSQGVATLSGNVSDDAARLEAYKLAAQTPGVKKVDDQMSTVSAPPQAADNPQPAPPAAAAPAPASEQPKPDRKSKRRAAEAKNSNLSPQASDASNAQDSVGDSSPATPAESPAPPVDPTQSAENTSAATPTPTASPAVAADAAPGAPEPKDIEIPAGMSIRVRMIDPVNSSVNKTGEVFHASLEYPIVVDNQPVVPKGADVFIRLTRASSAGSVSGRSELHLELVKLDYAGRSYALVSSTSSVVGGSKAKKTATSVGAGAVIGSIIGAIAGGGRGAAIGAGVGAAGGGVYAASTRGEQVKVPAETLLDFKLEQPATITVPPHTSVSGD
jgi:BON domain